MVCVLGGDMRQLTVAQKLRESGFLVEAACFDSEYAPGEKLADFPDALKRADIVVLPVPAFSSGLLNTPCYHESVRPEDILPLIKPSSIVFGGRLSEGEFAAFKSRGLRVFDYMAEEELAVRNAVPTAEGAIALAMAETPFTIASSRCLVIGWGRIGRILSKMLSGLGAEVTVATRRHEAAAMVRALGMRAVLSDELETAVSQTQMIFNTAPAMVLGGNILSKTRRDVLIIDLASKPGGVDLELARELGINTIWALSLPGKVAPVTSGEIIADTILHKLEEAEV